MKKLKDKILQEAKIKSNNTLCVDSFLTAQLDIDFLNDLCLEFKKRFNDEKITKIITLESSSISMATLLSKQFENSKVLIYKENISLQDYINLEDKILIIFDILNDEKELLNLVDIVKKSKGSLIGVCVAIDNLLKDSESFIRMETLVKIESLENEIKFKRSNKKQKFLIMTASTGNGHNQAANNLKIEIEKHGDECKIVNIFKKQNMNENSKSLMFEKGYDLLISKMPKLYHLLYKLADQKLIKDIFSNLLILPRHELNKIVVEEKPDIIISAHPFSVPLVMNKFSDFDSQIPFIQIITDFKPHEMYVDKSVDAYITGSEYTKEVLIEKGISEDKIFVYGIPVKKSFLEQKNQKENYDFNLLIMGGSMGLNGIEKSTEIILNSNLDVKVTVVCGNNEKMKDKLISEFENFILLGKLKVLGFVDNINELMENSKLIITKPGGLTSTEAISKNLPMIIPFCIPGQEQENTDFLVNNNMAMEINDFEKLPEIIEMLMENRELYDEMVNSMKQLSQNYSVDKIIELAKDLISEKN